jgi:hypothetical protein
MTEPSRTGVKGDGDLVLEQPESFRGFNVVDLGDILDLGEVIARPQGTQLAPSTLVGPRGHSTGIRPFDLASGFQKLQISTVSHPFVHGPRGALFQHADQALAIEP